MSPHVFSSLGSISFRRRHFVLALIGLICALFIYRLVFDTHEPYGTIQRWAQEEDQLAHDCFLHGSLVEYSRWEIIHARTISTKFTGDQHDRPSRQSWALTALMMDSFSQSEQNLIELFSAARGLPGRLYALFLIHERAPSIYVQTKASLTDEMDVEIFYLGHDLLLNVPAMEIIEWIETGRFSRDTVLTLNDILGNWRCWGQTGSANTYYERVHLHHWNAGVDSPAQTVLDGLPPRVLELERKGVRPERRSGKRESSRRRARPLSEAVGVE